VGRRSAIALIVIAGSILAPVTKARGASETFPTPSWVESTGSVTISSPTVADIDGVQALIYATASGEVYAVNAITGANLPGWPEPVDIAPGTPTAVNSSPTVAFLDGPNKPPTIVIGAGSASVADQQGGLVAFRANGTVRFIFHTRAEFNEWPGPNVNGYSNSVFATPAVGDITGNGTQDIVFGSYDHRLYALTPQGKLVKGFPIDTADTIWSSPALYHVRGSNRKEDIFTGGDASGRDGCFGGFVSDVTYQGDAPVVVWQHCENQTISSSPAIGVINATGRPVVVVGTGFGEPSPYKSDTNRVFAFYAKNGHRVAGWPVTTAGPAFASPAIGVLPGSSEQSVVETSACLACTGGRSMIFAWSGVGRLLWSQMLPVANDLASPVLVDLEGTGTNDVVVGSQRGLFAFGGGTGAYLFDTSLTSPINSCEMQNSVAISNIAGEGWRMFETCRVRKQVALPGRVFDYPLPASPTVVPPWPMWRANPTHDGVAATNSRHPTKSTF
jgi:outer membrane protein assembly factor BamB